MDRDQVLLAAVILHVQNLAGSAISKDSLSEFPNVLEIFNNIGKSIGKNRKRTSNFDYDDLLEYLPLNYNSEQLSVIIEKWTNLVFTLGSSTKYDNYPYTYEEMENIHNKIFFSEFESIADYLFSKDVNIGKMFILHALVILGASVNITAFEAKAATLAELKKLPSWLINENVSELKSFSMREDALLLVPYQTASLLKTLTAGGGVAQAIESEDLEGGVTRLNNLAPKDPNKDRFKDVEDELRKLLPKR